MKTIELNPLALDATIGVLWGENMIPVANRVYQRIAQVAKTSFDEGKAEGLEQGQRDAKAPPAMPMSPETLYGDDMWPPNGSVEPQETPFLKSLMNAPEFQPGAPDFGPPQHAPDSCETCGSSNEPHDNTRLGQDELTDVFGERTACGRTDTALCSNFPGCGCIQ